MQNKPSCTFESAFFSKITTFHSSATLCSTLQKKRNLKGGGGIFLGGVSMGPYKFYLGTHKSGKKE